MKPWSLVDGPTEGYFIFMALIIFMIKLLFSNVESEVWNFKNEINRTIDPTLPNEYRNGIGLYVVPFDFCFTYSLCRKIFEYINILN